jgi:peroxiredoxin Q/BCP
MHFAVRGVKMKKVTVTKKTQKKTKTLKKTKAPAKLSRAKVVVGQVLPEFSLPATGGRTVALQDFKGKAVVLYFYPRDATPGCTVEGHDFSRLLKDFAKAGAEVYGVSRDSLKSHEKFKEREKYQMELLSDTDEKVCGLFGVMKLKNMYGKQVRGIERSTFVIGRDGKLVKEWRGVKVPGHAEEVLSYIKEALV